jgi:hypothetical protein
MASHRSICSAISITDINRTAARSRSRRYLLSRSYWAAVERLPGRQVPVRRRTARATTVPLAREHAWGLRGNKAASRSWLGKSGNRDELAAGDRQTLARTSGSPNSFQVRRSVAASSRVAPVSQTTIGQCDHSIRLLREVEASEAEDAGDEQ